MSNSLYSDQARHFVGSDLDPNCFKGYHTDQMPSSETSQLHSQNAEKFTHIKGRLLDQAMILFNCVPFQNGNFS